LAQSGRPNPLSQCPFSGVKRPSQFSPDFTAFNGKVLFNGLDTAGNNALWVTDGTAAGTHEIIGGIIGNAFLDLTVFNGEVLFRGADSAIWVTET
jgi:ELWxxDGT repeat protein